MKPIAILFTVFVALVGSDSFAQTQQQGTTPTFSDDVTCKFDEDTTKPLVCNGGLSVSGDTVKPSALASAKPMST